MAISEWARARMPDLRCGGRAWHEADPHVQMIVPAGARVALDGKCSISSRPGFLLPVRTLSKVFCRLLLTKLIALHDAAKLASLASLAPLAERRGRLRHLSPARNRRCAVSAKPPFSGPEVVLASLSHDTRRVANSSQQSRRLATRWFPSNPF
jgi:Putative transposase